MMTDMHSCQAATVTPSALAMAMAWWSGVRDFAANRLCAIEVHTETSESDRQSRQGPLTVVYRPTYKWPTSGSCGCNGNQ